MVPLYLIPCNTNIQIDVTFVLRNIHLYYFIVCIALKKIASKYFVCNDLYRNVVKLMKLFKFVKICVDYKNIKR